MDGCPTEFYIKQSVALKEIRGKKTQFNALQMGCFNSLTSGLFRFIVVRIMILGCKTIEDDANSFFGALKPFKFYHENQTEERKKVPPTNSSVAFILLFLFPTPN